MLEEENSAYLTQKCHLEEITRTVLPKLQEKVASYKHRFGLPDFHALKLTRIVHLSTKDANSTINVTDKDRLIVKLESKLAAKIEENNSLKLNIQNLEDQQKAQDSHLQGLIQNKVEFQEAGRSDDSALKQKLFELEARHKNLLQV